MSELALDSLEITNFRVFDHLAIKKLGRVNLIVGRNNVGKSTLLEALYVYANRGLPYWLWEVLETRNEGRRAGDEGEISIEDQFNVFKSIFHRVSSTPPYQLTIGPYNSKDNLLKITLNIYSRDSDEANLLLLTSGALRNQLLNNQVAGINIEYRDHIRAMFPLNSGAIFSFRPEISTLTCINISARGLDNRQLSRLWDDIALTSSEDLALEALRLISPGVERINFINDKFTGSERIPIVKMKDQAGPVPLRSLGDGMVRLFGLALGIANAKGGLLLVDEIENGLHYTVQPAMWQLVFEAARRFNVQVFATSHSWECIEAFQQAAEKDRQAEGVLIRLENKNGAIVPTLFDEKKLEVATRELIEVR